MTAKQKRIISETLGRSVHELLKLSDAELGGHFKAFLINNLAHTWEGTMEVGILEVDLPAVVRLLKELECFCQILDGKPVLRG